MMNVVLNGQSYECEVKLSLVELLQKLGISEQQVAVEINCEIVPRSQHTSRVINPGDRIEIVQAIGGG